MERLSHFQVFHQVLPRVPKDFKVNILSGTVVRVTPNHLLLHEGIQILLVILSPATWWKFRNFESGAGVSPCTFGDPQTPIILEHLTLETSEPRLHFDRCVTTQHPFDVLLDVFGIEGWDIATEPGPNPFRPIHQNHGKGGHVKVWFDGASIIVEVV